MKNFHEYFTPQPVIVIGSVDYMHSMRPKYHWAPFSWVMPLSKKWPKLAVMMRHTSNTLKNIKEKSQIVTVSFLPANRDIADEVVQLAGGVGCPDWEKIEGVNIPTVKGSLAIGRGVACATMTKSDTHEMIVISLDIFKQLEAGPSLLHVNGKTFAEQINYQIEGY